MMGTTITGTNTTGLTTTGTNMTGTSGPPVVPLPVAPPAAGVYYDPRVTEIDARLRLVERKLDYLIDKLAVPLYRDRFKLDPEPKPTMGRQGPAADDPLLVAAKAYKAREGAKPGDPVLVAAKAYAANPPQGATLPQPPTPATQTRR